MQGKLLLDKLKPTLDLSKPVFIIGGGPSLLRTLPDPRILDNSYVIGINNAYKLFPNAFINYYADRCWIGWHEKELRETFKGILVTSDFRYDVEYDKHGVYCFLNGDKDGGLSLDQNKVDGFHSGQQSLNIAIHLGFKTIILIGYDMVVNNRQSHWHQGHPRGTAIHLYPHTFVPGMNKIAEDIKKYDPTIKIINVNRESAVKCFEYGDVIDFIPKTQ